MLGIVGSEPSALDNKNNGTWYQIADRPVWLVSFLSLVVVVVVVVLGLGSVNDENIKGMGFGHLQAVWLFFYNFLEFASQVVFIWSISIFVNSKLKGELQEFERENTNLQTQCVLFGIDASHLNEPAGPAEPDTRWPRACVLPASWTPQVASKTKYHQHQR